MHWTGYNIEPTPQAFELLEENRPHSRNINAALSDKSGSLEFILFDPLKKNEKYFGALNRVLAEKDMSGGDTFPEADKGYKIKSIITVPCLTWCDLIEQERIGCIDLFILDTEGHEEKVIDGMKGCPVLPQVMCVENGWQGSIREKLDALGYVYDISYHDNHMYLRKDVLPLFALRGLHKNY